jgi:3-isopropylmalate/(R)-2-methylmalate dehydratase small subunit
MTLKGKVHKFNPNDNINTDYIISGRYKFKTQDINEMAKHLMEDIDPDKNFYPKITAGDFIVAGANFGGGSSREQAPRVIKAAKISAVIAKSFARIFYRNAFNIGLPLIEADTKKIKAGDQLEVDLSSGKIKNLTQNTEISFKPFPRVMQKLLDEGGLVAHLKKHGGFEI